MGGLRRGMALFCKFLQKKKINDVVTTAEVLQATNWKEATFNTYLKKNKFSRFVKSMGGDKFIVLQNGNTIKEDDILGALTQVNLEHITLSRSLVFEGNTSTYTLEQERGRGATAHVWEASDQKGRRVAVKVINPRPDLLQPTVFDNVRARFRRECKNGLKLTHPALVKYRDTGEYEGNPFLVMELAKNSIGDVLKAQGPLDADSAAGVVRRCAEALRYLHSQECVHRDVKPDNLLMTDRGVLLADLGIVRWSDLNPAFTSAGTLTQSSVQLGSWYYMAPEQYQSPHEAKAASDVYALGVTWYEMLTGDRRTPVEFSAQATPPAPVSKEINVLLKRMTSFDVEQRPSLEEVLATL